MPKTGKLQASYFGFSSIAPLPTIGLIRFFVIIPARLGLLLAFTSYILGWAAKLESGWAT